MRVAIYVQHLLGAGHLVRAMALAEALAGQGCRVQLLSGGFPVERDPMGYEYVQLPPTRAVEKDFTRLVDEQGRPVDDHWRRYRAGILLEKVSTFQPDLLVTETFPFGRRQFRFELEPLIEWVHKQPCVMLMASIRDVLQRRRAERDRQTVHTLQQYYDGVLVHADDSLFSLDASFPLTHEIEDKLYYTGYIHQSANESAQKSPCSSTSPGQKEAGRDEVIVSGGSGTVSARLLETARLARPLSTAKDRTWRLLSGRNHSVPAVQLEPGLIIEPNRADFFSLLCRCALSVSQAGYNTTLDVLGSGARSVMVPFSGDGETEQSDRAAALERGGRLIRLDESELTPKSLAYAIDRALVMTPANLKLNCEGAQKSAQIIMQRIRENRNHV